MYVLTEEQLVQWGIDCSGYSDGQRILKSVQRLQSQSDAITHTEDHMTSMFTLQSLYFVSRMLLVMAMERFTCSEWLTSIFYHEKYIKLFQKST